MSSLEIINNEIEKYKTMIIRAKAVLTESRNESLIKCLKNDLKRYEEKLVRLQQVKTELEAWYVLKPDLEHTENELGEHEIELKVFYTDADVEKDDTKEKYYKLKKALEVQDEKSN